MNQDDSKGLKMGVRLVPCANCQCPIDRTDVMYQVWTLMDRKDVIEKKYLCAGCCVIFKDKS